MSLRDGMTRPFTDYRAGDPYVLRDFSEKLHSIVQNEIGIDAEVFPLRQRLAAALRGPIEEHIFGNFGLRTDTSSNQGRLVLSTNEGLPLPYLVWSAGQREFVPLLLGLYWLLPASKVATRNATEWVVMEEPEMGLHPNGIGAVMNLVMELRSRGYRICISTHSLHVLDVIWALRFVQDNNGEVRDVLRLFGLKSEVKTRKLSSAVLKSELRTYYFRRDGSVHDISDLDPGSENLAEGGWGGLPSSRATLERLSPTLQTAWRLKTHDIQGCGRELSSSCEWCILHRQKGLGAQASSTCHMRGTAPANGQHRSG